MWRRIIALLLAFSIILFPLSRKLPYGMHHKKEAILEAASEIYAGNELLLNAALTTLRK